MKRRSPYLTDRETEAHVLATVNPQPSSHRLFFLSVSPLCEKYEQPLIPEGFYMLLLSCLSSAAPGTNQGPQTIISESEALLIIAFKADTSWSLQQHRNIFSLLFFFLCCTCCTIIFPFILSLAKPSREGLQFILHYTDPPPACFSVAYGHWGYSLSFTSMSRLITLIFFNTKIYMTLSSVGISSVWTLIVFPPFLP